MFWKSRGRLHMLGVEGQGPPTCQPGLQAPPTSCCGVGLWEGPSSHSHIFSRAEVPSNALPTPIPGLGDGKEEQNWSLNPQSLAGDTPRVPSPGHGSGWATEAPLLLPPNCQSLTRPRPPSLLSTPSHQHHTWSSDPSTVVLSPHSPA